MVATKELVGSMTLNSKVDITDPCYDKGTWCRMTTKCEPGEYTGYAIIFDEGEWGKRVASIGIYKDDDVRDLDSMEYIGNIGVDAGVAGFFNDKPNFHGDEWMKFLRDSGTYKENGEYDYDKNHYDCSYGLFSCSGYGDGGYDVYATPERDAFMIVFIYDDEEGC